MDEKKIKSREKSLEHYYKNIPYYREYYVRNKEKLLKYNKEYKHNYIKNNIVFDKKYLTDFKIIKGNFILEFD